MFCVCVRVFEPVLKKTKTYIDIYINAYIDFLCYSNTTSCSFFLAKETEINLNKDNIINNIEGKLVHLECALCSAGFNAPANQSSMQYCKLIIPL